MTTAAHSRSAAGNRPRPNFITDFASWRAKLFAIDSVLEPYVGTEAVILDPELLKEPRIVELDRQRRELIEKLKPAPDAKVPGSTGTGIDAGVRPLMRSESSGSLWKQLQALCSPPQDTITYQELDEEYDFPYSFPSDPNFSPPVYSIDTTPLRNLGLTIITTSLDDPEPMWSNIHLWTGWLHALEWRVPPNVFEGEFEVSINVRHVLNVYNVAFKGGWIETSVVFLEYDETNVPTILVSDWETVMVQRTTTSGSVDSGTRQLTRTFWLPAGTSNRRVALGNFVRLYAHDGYVAVTGRFETHSPAAGGEAPNLRVRFNPT